MEQRLVQSEKIRLWKPWTKSTGAKTIAGKAISSRNAYKGGARGKIRQLSKILKEQSFVIYSLK
jgi:hypothetical protein